MFQRSWAKVYIDDEYIETTPLANPLQVAPEKHLVKLVNPAFQTWAQKIEFKPGETVADAVQVIDAGGTVVIAGLFDDTPKFDPLTMLMKEVRIVASMVYNRRGPASDFDTALEILAARGNDLRPLVTHTFPLADAQRAFGIPWVARGPVRQTTHA